MNHPNQVNSIKVINSNKVTVFNHALTCATDSEKVDQWGFSGYTMIESSDECLANHVSFFPYFAL